MTLGDPPDMNNFGYLYHDPDNLFPWDGGEMAQLEMKYLFYISAYDWSWPVVFAKIDEFCATRVKGHWVSPFVGGFYFKETTDAILFKFYIISLGIKPGLVSLPTILYR